MAKKNEEVVEPVVVKEKTVDEIGEENRVVIFKLVKEGKLPKPRALTRKERKELDKAGLNMFKSFGDDNLNPVERREACADFILDTLYPDFDFDLPNGVCLFFGSYIFGLSYGAELAEKN